MHDSIEIRWQTNYYGVHVFLDEPDRAAFCNAVINLRIA